MCAGLHRNPREQILLAQSQGNITVSNQDGCAQLKEADTLPSAVIRMT